MSSESYCSQCDSLSVGVKKEKEEKEVKQNKEEDEVGERGEGGEGEVNAEGLYCYLFIYLY